MTNEKKDKAEKNITEKGVLYLVATPIGNLADFSERALKVLSEVDFIAAEDTRNAVKLLNLLNIKKPLTSYFEHNKRERGLYITEKILNNESCALITDAGTPAISDPGEDLVKLCHEKKIKVISVPGACAAICALSVSGLYTGRFVFEGFLSVSKSKRLEHLQSLENEQRTLIFYEAPHKLRRTLADMLNIFGDRKITLCRELTKINEEIIVMTLKRAVEFYGVDKSSKNVPIGEFVLVIEGKPKAEAELEKSESFANMSCTEHIQIYIDNGLSKMDAIKKAANDRNIPKGKFYKALLEETDNMSK